jgi:hypothetical protein
MLQKTFVSKSYHSIRYNMALASRMSRELKKLEKCPPPGICAWPVHNSITQLEVQLQGPSDTPYEHGLFKLTVVVPERCLVQLVTIHCKHLNLKSTCH